MKMMMIIKVNQVFFFLPSFIKTTEKFLGIDWLAKEYAISCIISTFFLQLWGYRHFSPTCMVRCWFAFSADEMMDLKQIVVAHSTTTRFIHILAVIPNSHDAQYYYYLVKCRPKMRSQFREKRMEYGLVRTCVGNPLRIKHLGTTEKRVDLCPYFNNIVHCVPRMRWIVLFFGPVVCSINRVQASTNF